MTKQSKRPLVAFVFITGFVITAIEITASRALAPYFGTSLFVWSNVIGITLTALALGYALGGKLADRTPRIQVLATIVIIAGVYTSFIPIFIQTVARFLTSSIIASGLPITIFSSFAVAVILFFPPIFLLGMVSPYAIRLAATRVEESGSVAGTIFAASTLGSIAGIFTPAFYLIPFVGVRETFFLGAGILISAGGLWVSRRAPWVFLLLIIPLGLYLITNEVAHRRDGSLITERDTAYQYIRVTRERDGALGLRVNDGFGLQSLYHPNRVLTGTYFDAYALLPYVLNREPLKVLLVGLAGGTISRELLEIASRDFALTIDGVEIDGGMVELARELFALERDGLTVHVADGRVFLNASEKKYDIIIIDAFAHQIYIPHHLATREFFAEVRDHLTSGGVLALNVSAFSEDAELLQRIGQTLGTVFKEVRQVQLAPGASFFVVASATPLDLMTLPDRVPDILTPFARTIAGAHQPPSTNTRGRILTDNCCSTELLTELMYYQYVPRVNQ